MKPTPNYDLRQGIRLSKPRTLVKYRKITEKIIAERQLEKIKSSIKYMQVCLLCGIMQEKSPVLEIIKTNHQYFNPKISFLIDLNEYICTNCQINKCGFQVDDKFGGGNSQPAIEATILSLFENSSDPDLFAWDFLGKLDRAGPFDLPETAPITFENCFFLTGFVTDNQIKPKSHIIHINGLRTQTVVAKVRAILMQFRKEKK